VDSRLNDSGIGVVMFLPELRLQVAQLVAQSCPEESGVGSVKAAQTLRA
jgi:hypothetical protein